MSILPYPPSLKAIVQRCQDALLPNSCVLCGADSRDQLLCAPCRADLPAPPAARCPICGDATTHGERCGACLKSPPAFDRSIAPFPYEFPVDRLVHALKYGHQLALASWFSQQVHTHLATNEIDRVIPIPLHPDRLRERGFNQSAEMARGLAKGLACALDLSSLVRTRATPPQASLKHDARARNIRGAFECSTDLREQRILLVDDVLTTGATANECARILKIHGAATVIVATAARALKR